MIIAWIGLVLCQFTPETFSTTVNITALSTEFLLAFPRLQYTKINLLMYTRADMIMVKLYLTNPGSSIHSKLNEVLVQGSMPVQYHQSTTELDMPSKEYSHLECLLLTSDQPFGVFVHLYDGNDFLSSFMALPVQAFGKVYMVITHLKQPFLIVMAQRKTKLFVSLSIDPVHDLVVDGEIHPVGTHNWRTILLESYQAFSLSKCLDKSLYPNISLTGSRIESTHPIGVISGSCSSIQDNCKEDDYSMPDLSSEMLLPERMYGLRFVIVYSHQRTDKDLAWVTPSELNTTVLYYYKTSINTFHLKELVVTRLNLFNLNGYAVSDKPVAMYLYINTTCQYHQDKGGPSISVVMPNELFFNFYAWVSNIQRLHRFDSLQTVWCYKSTAFNNNVFIETHAFDAREKFIRASTTQAVLLYGEHITRVPRIPPLDDVVNFISLVIPVYDTFENMLWNGGPIPYINVTKDEGLVNFRYNIVILELRSNATDGVLSTYFYFGCYFSGFSKGSFFQAAGFNYVDEKFTCSPSDDFNGDTKDNDCDGIYDEEIKNGLDDDGDGLIDEDTYNVSGCSMFGRWGRHCLYGCSDYCREDCDKDYGVCFDCVDGRMMPTNICLEVCPEFTYGNHCQENCSIKCNGKDCLERSTGECEPMGIEVTVPWATTELNGTTVMPQTTRMPDTVKPFNSTIPSNTRKVTTTKLPQTTQHDEHEKKSVLSKLFLALVVISTIIGALGVIYCRIKSQPSVEELVAAFEAKPPVKEEGKEASPERKIMSKEQVPATPKKSMESVSVKKLSVSSEATTTWV